MQRAIVEYDDVLENEHEALDLFRKFRIVDLECFRDRLFRRTVDAVQDLDDSLYAARRGEVLRDERGQFTLQDLLHLSYNVR